MARSKRVVAAGEGFVVCDVRCQAPGPAWSPPEVAQGYVLVFVRAALSWFSPYPTSGWQRFVFRATEPVLAPVRRWVPPVSGLDLSPLVVTMVILFVIAAIRSIG